MDKEPEIIDVEVIEKEVVEKNGASDFQKGLAVFFVIMSMLYAISPIDLAPDAIPVVGWLDDAGVVLAATMNAIQQFSKDQNSSMVKILKYTKWLLVLATVIAALLLGGLLVAIGTLIAHAVG